ncbi:FadR/GntR family transcriptional regulator [Actinomadura vinacea]|uniref:FadR/GntR family transcriptional regulator n=1 Tax=Actinomadura vinacea TaxID=115336 RepID=A0ABN3IG48_9ACTN
MSKAGEPLLRHEPRRTEKTSERIARRILRDIGERRLAPGTFLESEAVMAEAFGVGRASVREALRILEINGLVTIKTGPGGGPVVATPSTSDYGQMTTLHLQAMGTTYRELLQARVNVESLLAGLAAARPGPEAGRLVTAALEAGQLNSQSDDTTYANSHSEFHAAVSQAAGDPVLALSANAFRHIWSVRVTAVLFPPDQRPSIAAAHDTVARAIVAHDRREAEWLMRQHMEFYQQYCELRYPARLDDIVDWG